MYILYSRTYNGFQFSQRSELSSSLGIAARTILSNLKTTICDPNFWIKLI